MTFRLVHISDIHLGPLPKVARRQLFSKRITGYVNFRRNRSNADQPEITRHTIEFVRQLKPDHTVITGDLINLGLDQEIENAHQWLKGFGYPADQTIVLGNHDAYVRGARDKALHSWQEWVIGDDKKPVSNEKDYPVIRRRGPVSIIACNSARASAPFLATGYFHKPQGKGLRKALESEQASGQICVILIHHPPYPRATQRHKRLIGLSHFTRAVRDFGADLVLHGHTHLATEAWIDGPNHKVPVICVPAAYQWSGYRKPPAGINLFTLEKGEPNHSIRLERYSLRPDIHSGFECVENKILRA